MPKVMTGQDDSGTYKYLLSQEDFSNCLLHSYEIPLRNGSENSDHKRVWLNCGSNKGAELEWFLDNVHFADETEIHLFEPTPGLGEKYLTRMKEDPQKQYINYDNITLHDVAVWDRNEKKDFHKLFDVQSAGSTLYGSKIRQAGRQVEEVISVDAINFSEFITDSFSKDDYIAVLMDIEGSEFKVLYRMIKDGLLYEYINQLDVEMHTDKLEQFNHEDVNVLLDMMKKFGEVRFETLYFHINYLPKIHERALPEEWIRFERKHPDFQPFCRKIPVAYR